MNLQISDQQTRPKHTPDSNMTEAIDGPVVNVTLVGAVENNGVVDHPAIKLPVIVADVFPADNLHGAIRSSRVVGHKVLALHARGHPDEEI